MISPDDLDLHGVVNDIAKRNGVNPEEFRKYLIGVCSTEQMMKSVSLICCMQKWLGAEVPISDEEREMYLPSMRVQINNVLNSREEIAIQMRLLYLFRSLPLQAGIHYLLSFVSQVRYLNDGMASSGPTLIYYINSLLPAHI